MPAAPPISSPARPPAARGSGSVTRPARPSPPSRRTSCARPSGPTSQPTGSGWWVDPVDAALLAAVELAVDAEAPLLYGRRRGADRGRTGGRAPRPLRCRPRRRRPASSSPALVPDVRGRRRPGGGWRRAPAAARRAAAAAPVVPVAAAGRRRERGVLRATSPARVLPLAGCTTFADLLARVEAERGSLAGDDRFLLVRRGFDPAILPLECRYLVCDGALIVIGPDAAGGEQVWAAEAASTHEKGRERRSAPGPRRAGLHLHHPHRVAGRVAEAGVEAVGLLGRLLAELDALRLQLLVRAAAVVGGEEQAAGGALRDDRLELRRTSPRRTRAAPGRSSARARPRTSGRGDGEPPEVAHLRRR